MSIMELLENRTSWIVCLFSFVMILECSILQVLSADINTTAQIIPSHCVWYGECNYQNNILKQNCPYDGPPKPLNIQAQKILEKWCPEFASDGVKTCCDTAQAKTLDMSLVLVENFLKSTKCPSCIQNFLKHVCAMTCSPEQSRFLNVTEVRTSSNGTKFIAAIDYYISNSYLSGVFNSCEDVFVPSAGQWALDFLCGEWGAKQCTPMRWFYHMGDSINNPFVPFQITYINSSKPVDEFIPMNSSVVPCLIVSIALVERFSGFNT